MGSNPTGPTNDITDPIAESMYFKDALVLRTKKATRENNVKVLRTLSKRADHTDPKTNERYIQELDRKNKNKCLGSSSHPQGQPNPVV